MCCRLQLDLRELLKRGNGLFGSAEQTGSLGVVTLNCGRLGYLFKDDERGLMARLDQLLNLAWKGLVPMGLALVAWGGVLAYAGGDDFGPRTVWALIGELVLLLVAMAVVKAVGRLTGRQANMPPVAVAS